MIEFWKKIKGRQSQKDLGENQILDQEREETFFLSEELKKMELPLLRCERLGEGGSGTC